VLDAGEIVEFGEPKALLAKDGGVFQEMCRKSADWPQLIGEESKRYNVIPYD